MPSKQVNIAQNWQARPKHDRGDRKTNMPSNQQGKKTKLVSKAALTHTHCRCHTETPFFHKNPSALTPFYTETL